MAEQKKMKKASDEQKEHLLTYMEENIEFAHDRFESSDGAHLKSAKWEMLAVNLNSIGGAWKDVHQWRKYWRDQKLHAKEREALIKASFQRSGVNGTKKIKQLSPFEERVVALLAPASISGADVPELFISPQAQGQADMRTTATPRQPSQPIETPEDDVNLSAIVEASDVALEMGLNLIADDITAVAGPSSVAAARPTPRKRKNGPSGKHPEMSCLDEKIIKIEEAKLSYVKKCYELQEKAFNWKKEYEGKLIELRQREVAFQEKELKRKMKK